MSMDLEAELMPLLDDGDGPTHMICCDDDHLAYCGKRLRATEFEPDESPVTCAGCIIADEDDVCPRTGRQCPHA